MVNVSSETGPTPAPQSLLTRVIGILTSPGATFKAIVAHPRWLGVLLLTCVVAAAFTALPMTTEGGQQAAIDQNVKGMEAFGVEVTDEVYAGMQRSARFMPYTTGGAVLVMVPIMSVIIAGILFGIFAIMGGGATFKQLFAVYVHAGLITTVGSVFTGTLNYFREAMTSATNLTVVLPMLEEGSFVARLTGFVDLFAIWWLIVLSIGLGVLYRKRTQSVAITLFSIYAVIALCVAGVMSMLGGS